MVTLRLGGTAASLLLGGVFGLAACGSIASIGASSRGGGGASGSPGGGAGSPPGTYVPGASAPQNKYAGTGFVVHEWGTNTIVVGSDGSMQRGLHHEEEDLPSFVYDRIKQGELGVSVDVKMETPVLYFYSDKPLTAQVSVSFPAGVLTQWYPQVQDFLPHVGQLGGPVVDPVMDPRFSFQTNACTTQFADGKAIANGRLDWGDVHVGVRGDAPAALPYAPLDRYTWAHARAVDANAVSVGTSEPQEEAFLFYRGLGNFTLGATVQASTSSAGSSVTIQNNDAAHAIGAIFVLNVGDTTASFAVHPQGLDASQGALSEPLASAIVQPIDAYAEQLAQAMTAELDKTGLFHDEAVAMVNTWRRQWFKTPGARVLYLAPQAWTDAQIPLAITPAPDAITRVMVIRTEVITPAQEAADVKAATQINGDATANAAGAAYFTALGRFAEPRLRRARQLMADGDTSACAAFLAQIAGANTRGGTGE